MLDRQTTQPKPRVRGELTRDTGGSEGAVATDNTILGRGVVRTTTRSTARTELTTTTTMEVGELWTQSTDERR